MKVSYYPGCSLESIGKSYDHSTREVCRALGVELEEAHDWVCCGSSAGLKMNKLVSTALSGVNLALYEKREPADVVAPCPFCYRRLASAQEEMRQDPKLKGEVQELIEAELSGKLQVHNLVDFLRRKVGLEAIAAKLKKPLAGLKVVPYYGCLLVRPPRVAQFDDPDDPRLMASLLRAAGAEVMPWSHATDCCGAGLSLPRSDAVYRLVGRLAERAREAGAEALVTACPLCQVNLEMRQPATPRLPAFYFTELLGLAFDLPEARRWWPKHLIDPRPLLRSHNLAD